MDSNDSKNKGSIGNTAIPNEEDPKQLIIDLCKLFYSIGWCTGTGGGISIRKGNEIFIAPSGVQKEKIELEDIFVQDIEGKDIYLPPSEKKLKKSQCTPLFMNAYRLRNAGAIIHAHSAAAVKVTLITPGYEFKISHIEMIKGLKRDSTGKKYNYHDTITVPIIENTPFECELEEVMARAMKAYPDTCCVLVRRHGFYIWGSTWQEAKTMSECYEFLFEQAVFMKQMNIDLTASPVIPQANIRFDLSAKQDMNDKLFDKIKLTDCENSCKLSHVEYEMTSKPRGQFIIINNVNFKEVTKQETRVGSDSDSLKLQNLFESLGFEVKEFRDETVSGMRSILQDAAKRKSFNLKSDCFGCAILTHGTLGAVYGTDNIIRINELAALVDGQNCPELIGKPKIFIIQTCRGLLYDDGARIECTDAVSEGCGTFISRASEIAETYRELVFSDFIFAYSCFSDYVSWRNETGSVFIQAITTIFEEYSDSMDLMKMLALVCEKVATYESNTKDPNLNGKKQIPSILSYMTKILKFKPGNY
ncbi:DgyrCDS9087 [Dimorphilus gyrociliatus]|uniref:Probable methylthioribulose-1-phosphate dehydratase n=1 Tax=Dimorphilus gyrociliatus TaxID=2664684 RepID=A0A7I8VW17_9ANNE|nr:DgyrCDS9087 [Dimorphilus gyrociliatus]